MAASVAFVLLMGQPKAWQFGCSVLHTVRRWDRRGCLVTSRGDTAARLQGLFT